MKTLFAAMLLFGSTTAHAQTECALSPIDGIRVVLAGAGTQYLYLRMDTPGDACRLPALERGATVAMTAVGDSTAALSARVDSSTPDRLRLRLDAVPSTLPERARWELTFTPAPQGKTYFAELGSFAVAVERLSVIYQHPSIPSNASGPAETASDGNLAAIDPLADEHSVVNEARVALPPGGNTWTWVNADDRPGNEPERGSGQVLWCVLSQRPGVLLLDDRGGSTAYSTGKHVLVRSGRVRFVVPSRPDDGVFDGSIDVRIRAVISDADDAVEGRGGGRREREDDERCREGQVLAVFPSLTLAVGAQRMSIPMPVESTTSSRISLHCGNQMTAGRAGAIAPMDRDLDECSIAFHRLASDEVTAVAAYGRQRLLVSIADGDGEELTSFLWEVDPGDCPQGVCSRRPFSLSGYDATELVVGVRVLGNPPRVHYRTGTTEAGPDGADIQGYEWSARVLPRGVFGMPIPLRVFITVPVIPLAIRTPALTRNLETSTDATGIEAVAGTTGVLLGLELWDYLERANLLAPANLRLGLGLLLFDLDETRFRPSFVAGLSFSLPIIEAPSQLGTSVSLSAFLEYDFASESAHALFALSVDVLSLFSPNTE